MTPEVFNRNTDSQWFIINQLIWTMASLQALIGFGFHGFHWYLFIAGRMVK